MKKALIVTGILLAVSLVVILVLFFVYQDGIRPVSSNGELIKIEVEKGSTYNSITDTLYDNHLIKSKLAYKIYVKTHSLKPLNAGTYYLSENMGVEKLVETLGGGGTSTNPDQISITFKEGLNMRGIAKVIAENTNNTEKDVYDLLKDKDYLNGLISKYWFIDRSILSKDLYYPLEGYLYPNTYFFKNKDVKVEEIFETMIKEMEKQLEPIKDEFALSNYTAHEIFTLASIAELEAREAEDRKVVVGIFENRMRSRMSLGSDVTAYYGAQVDMSERDLYKSELEANNGYNTRANGMIGKLPVGPICNMSISSIKAVIEPTKTDYFYFVSDKNGSMHYTRTYEEHLNVIQELKDEGLWYEY